MLIRYPGSKDKHLRFLESYFPSFNYEKGICEPFAGTASVTFYMLQGKFVDYYHINDFDSGIAALWNTVKTQPEDLKQKIKSYKPNVKDFYKFKNEEADNDFDKAFQKIVIHQISFSGLGMMAGGPLGGREQKGAYNVLSRWRPEKISANIEKCSNLLNSADGKITNESWETVLTEANDNGRFIYLDPPYYERGANLYIAGDIDHAAMAEELQSKDNWLLSYNDLPEIRKLYKKNHIETLNVRSQLHHNMINEVAIYK
jgi:DNA adenine methylase